jgi:hypothetical protein
MSRIKSGCKRTSLAFLSLANPRLKGSFNTASEQALAADSVERGGF